MERVIEVYETTLPLNRSEDLNQNKCADKTNEESLLKNNNIVENKTVLQEKNKLQHYNLSSFFLDHILQDLKTNLDTLFSLQGVAREFFECFIQKEVDIGWRKLDHSRFVGLIAENLLVTLPHELSKMEQGNTGLYKEISNALKVLMTWVGLKFKINEEFEDKLLITGYIHIKDRSSIFQFSLNVMVPREVDDIVHLICIGNEMVNSALKTFTKMLTITATQLSKYGAMPLPTVPKFKHPDFDGEKDDDE